LSFQYLDQLLPKKKYLGSIIPHDVGMEGAQNPSKMNDVEKHSGSTL